MGETSHEQRREQRDRVQWPGRVALEPGAPFTPCAVRDLSATGARLSFLEPAAVPDVFDLHLVTTGTTCRSEVRWRRGLEVGVRFLSRAEPDIAWGD